MTVEGAEAVSTTASEQPLDAQAENRATGSNPLARLWGWFRARLWASPSDVDSVSDETRTEPRADQIYPPSNQSTLPLSIHPDPKYYVRTGSSPFERICKVIDSSNGGVVGVTGERGAGKSVLLNKLSERYSETHLTVSLAAPVSSAREMEFFMMLFRHLTQRVIGELESRVENSAKDIQSVGRQVLRGLRFRRILAATLSFALISLLMLTAYGSLVHGTQRSRVAGELSNLRFGYMRYREPEEELTPSERAGRQENEAYRRRMSENLTAELRDLDNASWPWLPETTSRFGVTAIISAISAYLILAILWFAFRGGRLRSRDPNEIGLLSYARQIASRLDYELTRSSDRSVEATGLSWLRVGIRKGIQEKTRALSLPELTISYIDFVAQVLRVFPDKIVITIDELDKVSDVAQVSAILREIKGALYVRGTYYVLSMANDALRSFEGRLGDQRDIFESTFDDVFVVRPLNLQEATDILGSRLSDGRAAQDSPVPPARMRALQIIAIFSAGNARDLIRGFRDWVLATPLIEGVEPIQAWRILFSDRVQSISDRVASLGAPDDTRYRLDRMLSGVLDETAASSSAFYGVRSFQNDLTKAKEKDLAGVELPDAVYQRLQRYALELDILIRARIFVAEAPVDSETTHEAEILLRAYQKLPSITDAERELAPLGAVWKRTAMDNGQAAT